MVPIPPVLYSRSEYHCHKQEGCGYQCRCALPSVGFPPRGLFSRTGVDGDIINPCGPAGKTHIPLPLIFQHIPCPAILTDSYMGIIPIQFQAAVAGSTFKFCQLHNSSLFRPSCHTYQLYHIRTCLRIPFRCLCENGQAPPASGQRYPRRNFPFQNTGKYLNSSAP